MNVVIGQPFLSPIEPNEHGHYKFELWQIGKVIYSVEFDDLNSARKYYSIHGACDEYAVRLYINHNLIPFMEMSKALKIPKNAQLQFNLKF